ncbi:MULTISPECIES: AbrB/MazE/SpoVT family DNA-binding domain-containing protein [Metallosphaera]|uniref:SpoVT/AbrB domain protein n=3 Tax=Metallosphaera TaxID=41980 RepID=A4YHB2_METS5|nr:MULTISPECIES: AbrB/MazE/SpoVT family DNA-binding domain-containing protein [Metallosphaera]ABP95814.1 SpoVT/AbrB domain protein [Metallosphaera sedula DSM 5348]AIM27798.1 SpoVT/AbrB domain protein [Metallosphaera sedula]AKV74647.1 AbrB family transcriptional regulator [Metallosphaera sedula]AKV76884.1 AbrB family transcriptional regulator [Metallosphaera sedula]AKV79135.1 AbrB family transcriptional regulator [Metallosphaera sedula]
MEELNNAKDIETRKVQKLGSSSLFITLPKKWINKWNVKPGDKILIEVSSDGSLKLIAEKIKMENNHRSIKIDVDSLKQPIPSIIPCLYTLGYDEIILESRKSIQQKDVEDLIQVTKQIVGVEVTETSETRIKVECLLDTEKVGIESLLRRMLNTVAKRVDEVIALISGETPKENAGNHEDLRRLYYMLMRRVMGSKYETAKNMTKNSLIVINTTTLLNVDTVIDKLMEAVRSSNPDKEESKILVETLKKVNDLLDEVIMTVLFPSTKRVLNGLNLVKESRSNLSQLNNTPIVEYIKQIVGLLESALENSSCTLFLEDMPWIERNLT